MKERILRGVPVSPGIVLGSIYTHAGDLPEIPEYDITPEQVEPEIQRFEQALVQTRDQLTRLRARHTRTKELSDIIGVLLLLLDDPDIRRQTLDYIRRHRRNAETAYYQTTRNLAAPLARSQVAFVREKLADINDITQRVLRSLLKLPAPSLLDAPPGAIIAALDLPPSQATILDPKRIAAVALQAGGRTTHAAIMLKTREIPTLVNVPNLLPRLPATPQPVPALLDAYHGILILHPSPRRLEYYKQEQQRLEHRRSLLFKQIDQEPVTLDGHHIDIMANAENPDDCRTARRYHARGIGLYRTEHLIIAKRRIPDEQEQYQDIAQSAAILKPYPLTIRTFDLGGDKVLPGYTETNPYLGWRAIRYSLDNPDHFRTQLRAILRASSAGNLRIMFPMITTLEELRRAKLILNQTKDQLRQTHIPFDEHLPVGTMVETPAAALLSPALARQTDYLSIGSNDLTQYTLAVDRGNPRVARLYNHLHPAVLQLIKLTIDAAHNHDIPISLCGEMAADPLGLVILIALGLDEISVIPPLIPQTLNIIRNINLHDLQPIITPLLQLNTPLEVHRTLQRELNRHHPNLAQLLNP
jgi:phosphotransferase system enzyme I (PtsI)